MRKTLVAMWNSSSDETKMTSNPCCQEEESEKILALMANSDSKSDDNGKGKVDGRTYYPSIGSQKPRSRRENLESKIVALKNQVLILKNEKVGLEIEKLLAAPSKGKLRANDTQENLET
ncbi:hypothetical protein HAX54_018769 [Datura stramonium]|uniref:Uncharacterized protein n=1 Tax=Datura stramonium TaxID=4076 RepID=A0ABS8UN18_DATST|nr:hypothetical protein [Datura stramonium]